MEQESGHFYDLSLPLQRQLRLTARIGLAISVLSTLALTLTVYFLFKDQRQENYLLIIQSLTLSQDRLLPAMLIGGTLIALMAGLIIWFVLLYSSARIAGPLYRFKRNLELEISEGPVPTIQLRKGDYLQALSAKLSAAADGLSRHYDRQAKVLESLENHLSSTESDSAAQYQKLLLQLKRTASNKQA